MPPRLHTGGNVRRWIGRQAGGDEALGERIWRRLVHLTGLLALLYYVVPGDFFVVVTTREIVYALVVLVVLIELARHTIGLEVPSLRPYEEHRIASYTYYGLAIAAVLLFFPVPIGAVAICGTATIDPLIGELRGSSRFRSWYPTLPAIAYAGMAIVGFRLLTTWSIVEVLALGVMAMAVAILAERPRYRWMDDDLAMTLAPALVVLGLAILWSTVS
jgi:hypothetical protein